MAMVAETSMTTNPRIPTIVRRATAPAIITAMPATKHDPGQDGTAPGGTTEAGAAQSGGELGVLLDEGALHLLQRSKLFFGERHGVLPSTVGSRSVYAAPWACGRHAT